jgi:hypothetical protein
VNLRLLTKIVVVAAVLGLIGYDVYVFVEPTEGDTISEVTLSWAWSSAFVPFALGVLGGHLTWPRRASAKFRRRSALGLLIFGALLAGADFLGWTPDILPVIYFVPGVLAGHWFWPQTQTEA